MRLYYINLDSREDKRRFIEGQLLDIFENVERVPGVECAESEYVTPQVRGCVEAHRKIYKSHASQTEHNFCLILEDDAKILNKKHFVKVISLINEHGAKLDLDCVQLGTAPSRLHRRVLQMLKDIVTVCETLILNFLGTKCVSFLPDTFCRRARVVRSLKTREITKSLRIGGLIADEFLPGTQAYVISREFAEKIWRLNDPVFLSADLFLMSLARMCSFRVFRLRNNLFTQSDSFASDIGSNRFKLFKRLD